MFSAGYSTRLYKYIGIYNRYSDGNSLNCPAKIISPDTFSKLFRAMSVNVRSGSVLLPQFELFYRPSAIFNSVKCPREWSVGNSKYAYNPPNLCLLTHFWGIITVFFKSLTFLLFRDSRNVSIFMAHYSNNTIGLFRFLIYNLIK